MQCKQNPPEPPGGDCTETSKQAAVAVAVQPDKDVTAQQQPGTASNRMQRKRSDAPGMNGEEMKPWQLQINKQAVYFKGGNWKAWEMLPTLTWRETCWSLPGWVSLGVMLRICRGLGFFFFFRNGAARFATSLLRDHRKQVENMRNQQSLCSRSAPLDAGRAAPRIYWQNRPCQHCFSV